MNADKIAEWAGAMIGARRRHYRNEDEAEAARWVALSVLADAKEMVELGFIRQAREHLDLASALLIYQGRALNEGGECR